MYAVLPSSKIVPCAVRRIVARHAAMTSRVKYLQRMNANKIDAAQPAIVKAIRAAGASVLIVNRLPFDIVVGYRNRNYLLEIKNSAKGELTKSQVEFNASWRGQWSVVWNAEQALRIIGLVE
jgi:hypothetical protein